MRTTMLLALGLAVPLSAAIELRQVSHGEFTLLQVENSYFRVTLAPESGGRIISWHDKIRDCEMLHCKLPLSKDGKVSVGGLLDDRAELTFMPYECISRKNNQRVTIRMSAENDQKFRVSKALVFQADSPVVEVQYLFANHGHEVVSGFAYGQRGMVLPGGVDKVTTDCRYFLPTTHALRRLQGFTLKNYDGQETPELRTKLWTVVAAPWAGFLHLPSRQGLAVSFADDAYRGFYVWKPAIDVPTFEWSFTDIPAGHRRETSLHLIQVNDLIGLCHASPELLAQMDWRYVEDELEVTTTLQPLSGSQPTRLLTTVEQIGGKLKRNSTLALADVGMKELRTGLAVPGVGLFLITQQVFAGDVLLAQWRDVAALGDVPTAPVLNMAWRASRENEVIPGWQAPPADVVDVGPQAQERRFAVVQPTGSPQDPGNSFAEVDKLIVEMARNEVESRELVIYPLGLVDAGQAELLGGEAVHARLLLERQHRIDARDSGGGIRLARILYPCTEDFTLPGPVSLWLILGERGGCPVGEHTLTVRVTVDGRSVEVPVLVRVRDVGLPIRPLISLESEGYPYWFPHDRKPEKIKAWLENMTGHQVDFFQEFGRNLEARVAGTNRSLAQDLKANPDRYQDGATLPPLDFSIYDDLFDIGINLGMVRFKTCYYNLEGPDAVRLHYFSEGYKYVRSKGFQRKDIFLKLLDEQPADKFPLMVRQALLFKEIGYRPFSTFHQLFGRREQMELLGPVFEMFQGGFTTRAQRTALVRDGLLKPDAIVLLYTGYGTCWQPYEVQAGHGWRAAYLEHEMFHNHEYFRGNRPGANIIWFDQEAGLPRDSVGHEGLRDGMEAANLIALYRQWRRLLGDRPEHRELLADCDRILESIFTGPDACFPTGVTTERGIDMETLDAMVPREQFHRAQRRALDLLERIRPAALAAIPAVSSIRWDDLMLFAGGRSTSRVVCAPGVDSAMVDVFWQELARRIKAPAAMLRDPALPAALEIMLHLNPDCPSTYTIMPAGDGTRVDITAQTPERLLLAIQNWQNTMDLEGFWP